MNNRFKNPYFWTGLVAIIFSAAGVNFETLTSWQLLFGSIVGIFQNPVAIMAVVMAIIGVVVDPTTKGIKDNK